MLCNKKSPTWKSIALRPRFPLEVRLRRVPLDLAGSTHYKQIFKHVYVNDCRLLSNDIVTYVSHKLYTVLCNSKLIVVHVLS